MSVLSVDVAEKGLRENVRDGRALLLLIALPVLLILLFSFAFGTGEFVTGGSLPHEVVVINEDEGAWLGTNNTVQYANYGLSFAQLLKDATVRNSTTHLFHLNNGSKEEAQDLLKSRSIDALIIIPRNFSSAFVSMVNDSTRMAIAASVGLQAIASASNASPSFETSVPGANVAPSVARNTTTTLIVQGDSSFPNFSASQGLVTTILDQYRNGVREEAIARATAEGESIFRNYISVETVPMAGTAASSYFDGVVPGLIVFTLLLQMSVVASSLVRDIETGMLDRLKLSKIRSFDQLFGTLLTWTLITVGQILLLIGVAVGRGFHYQGGVGSLGLAVLIGVVAGMAASALALIIASFAKNATQAILFGAIIATPVGFMAGAFMPIPRQFLGEFFGRTYQVYDILPWTWAVYALRSVLTYGSGLSRDVIFDMAWLSVQTAIVFVIGVAIYSRLRLGTVN